MATGADAFLKHAITFKNQRSAEKLAKLEEMEAADAYDAPEYSQILMEDLYPLIQ